MADSYAVGHTSVIRLQEALLRGKRAGVTVIDGLGTFTWDEVIAFVDILLGMFWTDTTLDERNQIVTRYEYEDDDEPRSEMQFYRCRHDSLRFLAWLIEGWPNSLGASIGRAGHAVARFEQAAQPAFPSRSSSLAGSSMEPQSARFLARHPLTPTKTP